MTKLLIIDDEIILRQTISELFSVSGYEVIEAQDGLEGLKKVNQTQPDLIICDVMMPKIDGYGFVEQLKKTNYRDIPVLFLTAKTELVDQ
jgi:two-component system chemotaxis response regulator CheY